MKFFEDILKNRLKDATSHEGVNVDDLWAGIADALPEEETKRNFRKLWLLLPFLFIGGGILWSYFPTKSDKALTKHDTNIELIENEKQNSKFNQITEGSTFNEISNKHVKQKEKETAEFSETTTNTVQKKTPAQSPLNKIIVDTKTKTIRQDQQDPKSKNLASNPTPTHQPTVEKQNEKTTDADNSIISQELPGTNDIRIQNNKRKKNSSSSLHMSLLKSKFALLKYNETQKDLTDLILAIKPLLKTQKKEKNLNISLSAYAGTNSWKNYFENSPKGELLQNAYKQRLGYSLGTEVQFTLANNLTVSTGLEYSKTMTQFNIVQEKDGFTDNPNTSIVDENEVRAKIVRTVKHHNRLDFLTIPLVVSTSKEFGKFNLQIGAGLGLNFPIKQEGKSLNAQDEIATYSQNTSSIPSPYIGSFLSYHVRPAVHFKATENLSLQFRPEFRYNSHRHKYEGEQLDFFGLKHSSLMSRFSMGVNFKL